MAPSGTHVTFCDSQARNALPPGYDTNAETLVTDYLKALRQHTDKFLKQKLGEAVLSSTVTEYIIT